MQRSRLLGGAVAAVGELGYAGATVAHITSRARVSRRTFYDVFENREDCLLAVLEDTVARVEVELGRAGLEGLSWRERVRGGLFVILSFFDREPALARVCVVESARGSSRRVLERREEILSRLASVIDGGRWEGSSARECPVLVAEGLVGGASSIVYTRLLGGGHGPLSGLLGELMGMIVLPYAGAATARRERTRPAPALPQRVVPPGGCGGVSGLAGDPLRDVPMRLTYRTARVLEVTAMQPGVCNREIAEHAGIQDQGQVSKLLARLERLGLLANTGEGQPKGEPNAWRLTPKGLLVTESFRAHAHNNKEAAS